MGNCSTEKEQIGQPSKIIHRQQSGQPTEKVYVKPEPFVLKLPKNIQTLQDNNSQEQPASDSTYKVHKTQSYLQYQQLMKNPHKKYEEKHFKHDKKSICPLQQNFINFQWKRPHQFIKNSPVLMNYGEYVETTDFKLGKLQNEYFISAFATIAQNRELFWEILHKIFNGLTSSCDRGHYGISLFIDGKWEFIIIDDYFPVSFGNYLFSKYDKELWIMIIEKAYAKMFKSYRAIEKNYIGNFLSTLTGAPSHYLCKNQHKLLDPIKAWEIIRQAERKGHFICVSDERVGPSTQKISEMKSVFSYPVIETQQIYVLTQTDKQLERVVKLDNPWGRYQWKGRWSEYSDVWSQELRTQLQYQKADESVMWISIQDILINFGQICINRYNSSQKSNEISIQIKENEIKGVFIRVNSKTEGYLNLYQKQFNHFIKNYNYSVTRLILLSINQQANQFSSIITQTIDSAYCSSTPFFLQSGIYYVLFEIDWCSKATRDVVLNIYADEHVDMTLDPNPINNEAVFFQLMKLFEKQEGSDVKTYQYEEDADIERRCGQFGGYIYYHYKNNSQKNTTLQEHLDLRGSEDLQICDNPSNQVKIKLKPGEEMFVKIKICKEANKKVQCNPKFSYKLLQKYSSQELLDMLRKKPTKVKRREVDDQPIDVYIKTFEYSGGIALLYQNNMKKYSFIEQIRLQIHNLRLQNEEIEENTINLQLLPGSEKALSFVLEDPNKPYSFKTKVSYYLSTPEFKF